MKEGHHYISYTHWKKKCVLEQLYAKKLDILGQMDKFLERYKLPKWTQEEIVNLSNPVSSKEIEFIVKQFPHKEKSELDGFHW